MNTNIDNLRVNHPSYYQLPNGVECFDVIKYYPTCIGMAMKYLWRAGRKSEVGMTALDKEIEDLQKAVECINKEIELKQSIRDNITDIGGGNHAINFK